ELFLMLDDLGQRLAVAGSQSIGLAADAGEVGRLGAATGGRGVGRGVIAGGGQVLFGLGQQTPTTPDGDGREDRGAQGGAGGGGRGGHGGGCQQRFQEGDRFGEPIDLSASDEQAGHRKRGEDGGSDESREQCSQQQSRERTVHGPSPERFRRGYQWN